MSPLENDKDDSIVRSIQSYTICLNKYIEEANKRNITIVVRAGDRQGAGTSYKHLYLTEIVIAKIEQIKLYYPIKK